MCERLQVGLLFHILRSVNDMKEIGKIPILVFLCLSFSCHASVNGRKDNKDLCEFCESKSEELFAISMADRNPEDIILNCEEIERVENGLYVDKHCVNNEGIRDGVFMHLSPDERTVLIEGKYALNKKSGLWTFWKSNGDIRETGNYLEGKKEGVWFNYYSKIDSVAYAINYVDGKKHGPYYGWNEDGSLGEFGCYKNGEREGVRIRWSSNGEVLGENFFQQDSGCFIDWYDSGQVKELGYLRGGEQTFVWTFYNEDGEVSRQCHLPPKREHHCEESGLDIRSLDSPSRVYYEICLEELETGVSLWRE